MKSLTALVRRILTLFRTHIYIASFLCLVVTALVIGGVVFAQHGKAPAHTNKSSGAHSRHASPAAKQSEKDAPAAQNTTKTSNPGTDATAIKNTGETRTSATPPAASAQKLLLIQPTKISVPAGQSFDGLSVRANDNRPINMPMISSSGAPHVFLNFRAGPANQVWDGSISFMRTTPPGTYTVELMGQADRNTFYRGSITVTVEPTPLMSVSMQQTGYDTQSDVLVFSITINRLHGYAKPVESMYGQSWQTAVPLQFECAFDPISDAQVMMYCRHVNGPRPTGGTMHVNVNVHADSFSAGTAYNLPSR